MKKYKLIDLVSKGSYARRKVDSDVIVGNISNGFGYGDILDANAVVQLILAMISSGIDVLPKTITSDNIEDGSIKLEDLSQEALDKMTSTYDKNDETLYMNGLEVIN